MNFCWQGRARLLVWLLLLPLSGSLLAASAAKVPELKLPEPKVICAEIAPFYYVENGVSRGVAYEIGQELLRRLKYQHAIEPQPFLRVLYTLQKEKRVIVLWLGRSPEREMQFQWVAPILTDAFYIYTHEGRLVADSLEKARQLGSLAAVSSASYTIKAQEYGLAKLEFMPSEDTNGMKLLADRVDGWISLQASANFFAEKNHIAPGQLVRGVKLMDYKAWIAASQDVSPAEVQRWRQAFATMQQDGSYARITRKYHLGVPTPGIRVVTPE